MTPSRAIHDPVFLTYAAIVAGLLVAGGLAIVLASWLTGGRLTSVRTTYRSWWVMAPAVLLAAFGGRVVWIGFAAALSAAAVWEFARAAGLTRDRPMISAVYAGLLVAVACLIAGSVDGFLSTPALVVGLVVLVPVVTDRPAGRVATGSLAALAFLWPGWALLHLAALANSPHAYGYCLFAVLATGLSDVLAFTAGRVLGPRTGRIGAMRLRPTVSPNKTVAGAVGAATLSLGVPFALAFSFPPGFRWFDLLAVGAIVGVGGQLGDLAVSAAKRDLGVKDLGTVLPGHGGVLDRVDSLAVVAPLLLHYVRLRHGL